MPPMEISSLNKLPPHTPLSNDKQLLNGDWEFVGYEDVEEIPWPQLFDGQMPRTMPVPANWELHGFGSPRYINTRYTFEPDANLLHPPYIPAGQNPVGLYTRTFNHQAQAGFRDILAFNGFEGALFVYLNHQFVGYASNGRSVSEFDITELVHSGENQLHLVLAAFSAGSWLECQDMWRLKGINRDVYLTQVPERRIFDHYTHFDLDRSRLHIDAKILNDTPVLS